MSDDAPVLKFVKPAHEGATIYDPAHRSDLPAGGMNVVWDHYWIGKEMAGDVVVTDVKPEDEPEPAEKTPADRVKVEAGAEPAPDPKLLSKQASATA